MDETRHFEAGRPGTAGLLRERPLLPMGAPLPWRQKVEPSGLRRLLACGSEPHSGRFPGVSGAGTMPSDESSGAGGIWGFFR